MVICLERWADLHMALLMPLPLTISCSNKIQVGFTFLVPAHLGSPGQRAIKRVCVCVKRVCGGGEFNLDQNYYWDDFVGVWALLKNLLKHAISVEKFNFFVEGQRVS